MISEIEINNLATYREQVKMVPTEINYIYGCNGSGKTTLSNLIRQPIEYENCSIKWSSGELETVVYNRDFVKESFSQSSAIKGIFTLGKDTKESKERITALKSQIDQFTKEINSYKKTLNSKDEEKTKKTNEIIDMCWSYKQKYEADFKPAFNGYIKSKLKFFDMCKCQKNNTAELLEESVLKEKCKKIFNNTLTQYNEIEKIQYDQLIGLENDSILKNKIVGKEDIPIAKLIKKLNNSDWVKRGAEFLEKSDGICPFCQRPLDNAEFKNQIQEFFDDTYQENCKRLIDYRKKYNDYIENLITEIKEIVECDIKIIDVDLLDRELVLIKQKKDTNLLLIDNKIKSPSTPIELESLISNFNKVQVIIDNYIEIIKDNNEVVDNIIKEKTQLCNEIWKFIYSNIEPQINSYIKVVGGINKAEENINKKIASGETKISELQNAIDTEEAKVTSIAYSANEINRILKLFGFNNFKLAASKEKGYYKIIRPKGEDVNQTLSEGEYRFITFLYFYNLVKGSMEKTGIYNDKVVVIDDPISSLDSNVLFVVSNLVKDIIKSCNEGLNGIKQVFVLTHNVYFHKEITFKGSRESNTEKESFWIIRKLNEVSKITQYTSNPIQTTYELLWKELRDTENINTATVFNTMRRILEYYFNILGGKKYEKCIDKFEGEEKLICRSLISWINDGSHFIGDDLETPIEQDEIQKYLNVFRLIFQNMDQIDHYNMMMKIN